jgi:ATP-dependent Clp protease adaptor protein ClpS
MPRRDPSSDTETATRDEVKVTEPTLYRVILLNDDYTTMDFVVAVLEQIFKKSPSEATQIMLQVHNKGQGVCGVYPKQIAEAKIAMVVERAQGEQHPLQCIMEEA